MPGPHSLLAIARRAAAAGADAITGSAGGPIRTKASRGDIVTAADERAERAIRDVIRDSRPDDEILGEEGGHTGGTGSIRWIIDPIDGTTNYAIGLPHYAVSVAAFDTVTQTWEAGVVIAPSLGRTYSAERGQGAWLEHDGTRRPLRAALTPGAPLLLATGLSYEAEQRGRQLRKLERESRLFDDIRLCAVWVGVVSPVGVA